MLCGVSSNLFTSGYDLWYYKKGKIIEGGKEKTCLMKIKNVTAVYWLFSFI